MIGILPRTAPSVSTTAVITSQSLNKRLEGVLSITHKVSNSNTKFDLARPKPQVLPKPDKKNVLTSYNANSVKDNTRELRQVNKLDMKKIANVVVCLENKMNCINQSLVSIKESRPEPIINKGQGIPTPPPMPNFLPTQDNAETVKPTKNNPTPSFTEEPKAKLQERGQNAVTVEPEQIPAHIKPTENNPIKNIIKKIKSIFQRRGRNAGAVEPKQIRAHIKPTKNNPIKNIMKKIKAIFQKRGRNAVTVDPEQIPAHIKPTKNNSTQSFTEELKARLQERKVVG